ncbi:MAG: hypothetical protein IT381_16095 [Deltaproteobacteria bacterium]|nr:hypothetical protein [Deltaproteobacteria bacterium]
MKTARLQVLRSCLAPTAWASLFVLAATQSALFVDIAQEAHGYCVEHEGAVHHVDASAASQAADETLALNAPAQKKSAAEAHDHCEALGTGLRPATTHQKACTPRAVEPRALPKHPKLEAKPIAQEPVYATAPKTSPPRA